MEKTIQIRKGKAHSSNHLWWVSPLDWQRNINHYLVSAMPQGMKYAEENWLLSLQTVWQKAFCELFNTRQLFMPFLFGGRTEPYIDILENENDYTISADVPGVSLKNLQLYHSDNSLIIRGKRNHRNKAGDHYLHNECCHCDFERVIALPEDSDFKKQKRHFMKMSWRFKCLKKALLSP